MANMFYISLGAAVLGFLVVLFTPKGVITQLTSSPSEKKLEIVKVKELSR
jgi:nitrate reductase gamma subunit